MPNLRFKIFNQKWELKKIEEITIFMKSGGTPKSRSDLFYSNDGIPFLAISDIKNKYLQKTDKYITDLALEKTSTFIFEKDNLVYSIYATIGEISINKIDVALPQSILGIKADKSIIQNEYLYYLLKSNKNKILRLKQTGSQPNLSLEIFKNINLYLSFNLYEQEKISKFFSLLDQQISLLEIKLQLMEQIIKYLLSFELSYTNKKIGDEFYLFDGFSFKSTDYDDNGKKVILTIKNIGINKLELKKINRTNKIIENKYEINKNEIICSLTGAAGFKFSLSDSNYYFNQRTLKIVSKKNEFDQILMLLLLFRKNKDFISNLATGSQQNISKKDIKNLNFLKNDFRNIFIAKILSRIDKYVNMLIVLKELKIKRKNYYLKKIFL